LEEKVRRYVHGFVVMGLKDEGIFINDAIMDCQKVQMVPFSFVKN